MAKTTLILRSSAVILFIGCVSRIGMMLFVLFADTYKVQQRAAHAMSVEALKIYGHA